MRRLLVILLLFFVSAFVVSANVAHAAPGSMLWETEIGDFTGSRPALAVQGSLAVICNGSDVRAYDTTTGAQQWEAKNVGQIFRMAVSHDRVYLLIRGAVVCLSLRNGTESWRSESLVPDSFYSQLGFGVEYNGDVAVHDSRLLYRLNGQTGATLWKEDITSELQGWSLTSDIAIMPGDRWLLRAGNKAVLVNATDGSVAWQGSDIWDMVPGIGETFVTVTTTESSPGTNIYTVRSTDGSSLKHYDSNDDLASTLRFVDSNGVLHSHQSGLIPQWRTLDLSSLAPGTLPLPLDVDSHLFGNNDRHYVMEMQECKVQELAADTGAVLWTHSRDGEAAYCFSMDGDGRIIVFVYDKLYALETGSTGVDAGPWPMRLGGPGCANRSYSLGVPVQGMVSVDGTIFSQGETVTITVSGLPASTEARLVLTCVENGRSATQAFTTDAEGNKVFKWRTSKTSRGGTLGISVKSVDGALWASGAQFGLRAEPRIAVNLNQDMFTPTDNLIQAGYQMEAARLLDTTRLVDVYMGFLLPDGTVLYDGYLAGDLNANRKPMLNDVEVGDVLDWTTGPDMAYRFGANAPEGAYGYWAALTDATSWDVLSFRFLPLSYVKSKRQPNIAVMLNLLLDDVGAGGMVPRKSPAPPPIADLAAADFAPVSAADDSPAVPSQPVAQPDQSVSDAPQDDLPPLFPVPTISAREEWKHTLPLSVRTAAQYSTPFEVLQNALDMEGAIKDGAFDLFCQYLGPDGYAIFTNVSKFAEKVTAVKELVDIVNPYFGQDYAHLSSDAKDAYVFMNVMNFFLSKYSLMGMAGLDFAPMLHTALKAIKQGNYQFYINGAAHPKFTVKVVNNDFWTALIPAARHVELKVYKVLDMTAYGKYLKRSDPDRVLITVSAQVKGSSVTIKPEELNASDAESRLDFGIYKLVAVENGANVGQTFFAFTQNNTGTTLTVVD